MASDSVTGSSRPVRIERLDGHDLDVPIDTDHSQRVVADGANGARDVRPVIMIVHRISVVVDEVIAVDIVNESVPVVIHSWSAVQFLRIAPHVLRQILVGIIDPGIDDGHDRLATAGRDLPRLGRIDIHIRSSTGLPGVVQSPEFVEARIIGDRRDLKPVVGLGVEHVRVAAIGLQRGLHVEPVREMDLAQAGHDWKLAVHRSAADDLAHNTAGRPVRSVSKPHQICGLPSNWAKRSATAGILISPGADAAS